MLVEQPVIGSDQVAVALRLGHAGTEARPLLGEEPARLVGEPVDIRGAGHRDRGEDHLGHAIGMALSVGKAEGDAPGRAPHEPAVHAEVLAQPLDVRDQVVRGVRREVGRKVACVRRAAPAPALVELDDAVGGGIEVAPPARPAAAPGPAVEGDSRLAVGVAGRLPVDPVPIADVEHARLVRLDLRVRFPHGILCVSETSGSRQHTGPVATAIPREHAGALGDRRRREPPGREVAPLLPRRSAGRRGPLMAAGRHPPHGSVGPAGT